MPVSKQSSPSFLTTINRVLLITIGTLIGSVSVIVFFAPAEIAPSGVAGVSVILNHLFNTPVGLFILIGNLPILYIAFRMLGGWHAVIWTSYVVVLYAISIDMLTPFFPTDGVSDNGLLNAVFAGVIAGVGGGLILRAGGTFGGTSTLARIIQVKFGTPLSSTNLYVNLLIVGVVAVFLGWESALYSLVALVMDGLASDYILEGPSVIRTVTIITDHPKEVSDAILTQLRRGVTAWDVTGMFTGEKRHMLFVTVRRPQVQALRQLISDVDENAFVVVAQGHVAYGRGFSRSKYNKATDTTPAIEEE